MRKVSCLSKFGEAPSHSDLSRSCFFAVWQASGLDDESDVWAESKVAAQAAMSAAPEQDENRSPPLNPVSSFLF